MEAKSSKKPPNRFHFSHIKHNLERERISNLASVLAVHNQKSDKFVDFDIDDGVSEGGTDLDVHND